MLVFDPLGTRLKGINLIEASAGTGKTYAITSLFLRLVTELNLMPEEILVVTFTDAATKELRERIRKRLRETRDFLAGSENSDTFLINLVNRPPEIWPGNETALRRIDAALSSFDTAAISTIHGFCAVTLQERAFESGSRFDTDLLADQSQLLQEIADDFWRISFFGETADLLIAIERKKWTPEKFATLLKSTISNPLVKILPEFTEEEYSFTGKRCFEVYASITREWQQRGGEIEEIITSHKGLSRSEKNYRLLDAVPQLMADMRCYIAEGNPYNLFNNFDKFTSGYIQRQKMTRFEPPEDMFFDLCDELAQLVNSRLTQFLMQLFVFAEKELPKRKSKLNLRSYDDLLLDMYHALNGAAGEPLKHALRQRYKAALIDEFQDTDQIQYGIFESIHKGSELPLFLIGDPKQAIYSFRGADVFAYLQARGGVASGNKYTMVENWRSVPGLVQAVNLLFSQQPEIPFLIEHLDYPEVKAAKSSTTFAIDGDMDPAPLQLWFFRRQEEDRHLIPNVRANDRIITAVADEIASLLSGTTHGNAASGTENISPEHIAVIVRSHKQAAAVLEALIERDIPAVVQSNKSIFASDEAAELSTILAAIAGPSADACTRGALVTRILGFNGNDLMETLMSDSMSLEIISRFREYHALWVEKGFFPMFRVMLRKEGIRERLMALPGGERRLTNLQQCAELLHQRDSERRHGMDSLLTWFHEQIDSAPEDDQYQLRLESDEKSVHIVTVHLSKGLEYPIVFCPFTWGGVREEREYALCHEGYSLVADFGSNDLARHSTAAKEEALSENLRLLYVALTRAKYRCYLAWGKFRGAESSAPGYLLHCPEGSSGKSLLDLLGSAMKSLSDDEMISRCEKIVEEGRGVISLTVDPSHISKKSVHLQLQQQPSSYRIFKGEIDASWKVSSFTSLAAGQKESAELPDRDRLAGNGDDTSKTAPDAGSFFTFPGGTRAGTALHAIFEELDFACAGDDELKPIVLKHLARAGFDTALSGAVCAMVNRVLSVPIGEEGIKLSEIGLNDRLTELEFFLPLDLIDRAGLANILNRFGMENPLLSSIAKMLGFRDQQGILLGFMDLVFCHGGKYYIIDWKSNRLGNSIECYDREGMAREMVRHLYPLQYLLYTVALNRYLTNRDPSYTYAEHFGGVHYIFLRGVDPVNPEYGIFSDKPSEQLILELTAYLVAGWGE